MATVRGPAPRTSDEPVGSSVVLSSAQTFAGAADSTNTANRATLVGGAVLKCVTTIGATPTLSADIQGSIDGTIWFNIPYALIATPTTFVVTQITNMNSAATFYYILQSAQPWQYVKVAYSNNLNVTITTTVYFPAV